MKAAEAELPPSDRAGAEHLRVVKDSDEMNATTDAIADAARQYPGDVVNKNTAHLPDNQRSAIRRLHAYQFENSLSLGELEVKTGISSTTISQIYRNKYPSDVSGIVSRIQSFFALLDKRSQSRQLDFVETKLSKNIWGICDNARTMQKINFIFGDSQVGKSKALKKYALDHNHGSTCYLEMPTGGLLTNFMAKLAEKLHMSAHQRRADLRRRLIEAFDDRMLLVVDEAHQCLPINGYTTARSLQSIEFIREIFNEKECGVVICATKAFQSAMNHGEWSSLLAQSKRRQFLTLELPNEPTREDLNAFSRAYGLPAAAAQARELEKSIIATEALGYWLSVLRAGHEVASSKKQAMTWAHVLSAWSGILELQGKKAA